MVHQARLDLHFIAFTSPLSPPANEDKSKQPKQYDDTGGYTTGDCCNVWTLTPG